MLDRSGPERSSTTGASHSRDAPPGVRRRRRELAGPRPIFGGAAE